MGVVAAVLAIVVLLAIGFAWYVSSTAPVSPDYGAPATDLVTRLLAKRK